MRSLAVLAALLGLLVLADSGAAAPLADPAAALSRAHGLVERALQAPEAERPELARAALAALEAEPDLAGSAWLLEPLRADPPDLARARVRLAAAQTVLAQTAAPSPGWIEPAAARAALDRVLAEPRFHPRDLRALLPSWLDPVLWLFDEIGRLIDQAVRWLRLAIYRWALSGPQALVLGLLAAGGLLLLYLRGLRSALVSQSEVALPSDQPPPTAVEALAAAQTQAGAGHYRAACHYLLLSTLLWIEEHTQVRFDPTATNREHLVRLTAQPAIAAALAPFVARFDRIGYGQERIDDADYRSLLDLAGRVREAAV